ncbi:polymeric immunoglobulin receptor-like [Chanodichthys erythropterus]|uniref:polymeric immunoglobulin receptor-like n=1 Tax=Chanodichthys erythropterus TaxID=933992 RepID=UPI00351F49B3
MIHPLILSGILLYISGAAGVNRLKLNIAVKSGSSGIIPCVYDKQHKENRKYLCKGTVWSSCSILAYANETGKYSITDYPDQSIFTVRWDRLNTSDSGKYWCAVEIGDYGTVDAGYYLYLTVQSAPDVSVMNSSVSGHEGGNVSVQCFYSSGYQYSHKQWCTYKDQRCYTVGRTDTSQNPSIQISDDGRRSFTVLMTGLRLSDSGWFFCSVGELQVPVQLIVNEPKLAVTNSTITTPSDSETDMFTTQSSANRNPKSLNKIVNIVMTTASIPETHIDETKPSLIAATETNTTEMRSQDEQNNYLRHDGILLMSLVAMLVLLLLVSLVVIVTWRLRKKPERGHIREEEHFNSTSNATPSENQMTSSSSAAATSSASVDDNSVLYSSVIFHKASLSSVDPEGDALYSSVKKPRKAAH